MKKEVSICHSLMCLDLVSFPVLSRRLHSWRWPSVNRFTFQACDHASPRTQNFDFSRLTETVCQKLHQSPKKKHARPSKHGGVYDARPSKHGGVYDARPSKHGGVYDHGRHGTQRHNTTATLIQTTCNSVGVKCGMFHDPV